MSAQQRIICIITRLFEVSVRFYSIALLVIFLAVTASFAGQADGAKVDVDPQFQPHRSVDDAKRDAKRSEAMNKDRAQRIKRDTDKLLQLATELKEYVDKTNENVLSLDVVKKAEEVEKLAKSIREKMKEDYRIPDSTFPR
jgi:hypothetical protein